MKKVKIGDFNYDIVLTRDKDVSHDLHVYNLAFMTEEGGAQITNAGIESFNLVVQEIKKLIEESANIAPINAVTFAGDGSKLTITEIVEVEYDRYEKEVFYGTESYIVMYLNGEVKDKVKKELIAQ